MPKHINAMPRSEWFQRASYCRFFFKCQQSAGEVADQMGGPPAIKFDSNYTDAEAWANAGYLTTANSAVTDYALRAANANNSWNGGTHTAILALRLKKATPGSSEVIAGCFTSGSSNGGWQINCTSTGQVQLQLKPTNGGSAHTLTISNSYGALDSTERLLVWAVPREASSALMFVDGAAAGTSGMTGDPSRDFAGGFGLALGASLAGSAKAAQFSAVQLYTIERDLSDLRTQQIADFLMRYPHRPLPDWLLEA